MPLYPLNLKIQNKCCLIVGGGEVAARKIEPLLVCGAKVKVVSPTVCDTIRSLVESERIEWRERGYRKGDVKGAFLVFAATDNSEVQNQVIEEARLHDILLNCADIPDACSFQVPAVVRQGGLLLAVSTTGASPALSAWIRKRLSLEYGVEYGLLVDLFASIRAEVLNDGSSSGSHKRVFEKILETDILACLRNRDWPALQAELALCLPKSIDIPALVADLSTREPTNIQSDHCKDHDE
jgi:precorrin-2 dehydrogenase